MEFPTEIAKDFFAFSLACDASSYLVIIEKARLKSDLLDIPSTQSSANANTLRGGCLKVLMPSSLSKWHNKGLMAKLKRMGDIGSPCLKPRFGNILFVLKEGPIIENFEDFKTGVLETL